MEVLVLKDCRVCDCCSNCAVFTEECSSQTSLLACNVLCFVASRLLLNTTPVGAQVHITNYTCVVIVVHRVII